MTYAPPARQFQDCAPRTKSLAIEGWRGINHSFALVNQHQILELLKIEGLRLYHQDLPFAYPQWSRAANRSGLPADHQALIDALPPPGEDPVDCIYRIGSPFRAGQNETERKTVTFMVTEMGLSATSFAPGHADPALFLRDGDAIVTPSRWSRDRLADFGFPDDRISVIAHGVDTATFRPLAPMERQAARRDLGIGEDQTVFLNVGLSSWNKGIDLLLVAFARLRSAGRNVRLILKDQRDLYGRSVETLIGKLAAHCPDLVADDTLAAISIIPTNIDAAQLRSLYGIADAYVSPYRAEGFNLPVLEAVACGTPVIVTRGGATDDFCNDEMAIKIGGELRDLAATFADRTGRYVEPDVNELIDAMAAFVGGDGGLQRFAAGRNAVLERFTWRAAARELARITVGEMSETPVPAAPRAEPQADPVAVPGSDPQTAGPLHADRREFPTANSDAAAPDSALTSPSGSRLVNIAPWGAAEQSSYWLGSRPGEAANALAERPTGDFAFHTDLEDAPWWQVDLGASLPIEAIVVHNRVGSHRERARTLRIDIADRPGQWILLHAGYASFGSRHDGPPFAIRVGSELRARYIRVSLSERQYLHLSQVEVLVRREQMILSQFSRQHGLAHFDDRSTDFGRPYGVEVPDGAPGHAVVGLKTSYASRFGNLLQQYTHMIQLARTTGLAYIQLGTHELLTADHPFEVDGITFLPPGAPLPKAGAFITGSFFDSTAFAPLLSAFLRFGPEEEAAHTEIARRYLRPHLLAGLPVPDEQHVDDELTIHIRSGDLFTGEQAGNRAYRQPPLSFYTLVIRRMRAEGRITRVRLVFEDRGNPCIDALESWLRTQDIAFRVQCGTLRDDLSALLDAPHLVFGYGTFGYAICRMSKRIETLHFFAPELGGCYAHHPSIVEVVRVSDREGGYIAAGEVGMAPGDWSNTPEQRDTMLTYPEASLGADIVADRRSERP